MEEKIIQGTKLKILILEDSPKDAEIIIELLQDSGYILDFKVTAKEVEFKSLLFKADYDVILSDFSLPGFNAFGALKYRNEICPEIPFICVSGSIGEEIAIELLKNGADDYILKDRIDRLPFAINRAIEDEKAKSARKKAEFALKDSLQSYRILANAGQALIWTSGKDKLCNYFNEVWLKFTGRTLEQELGSGWTEGVHPDDLQVCLNTYIEAFERRDKFSMEYRVKRFDGVYRWIQDDGSPRYNIKGDFAGYIGHCLDITERKLAVEALAESEEKYCALVENALEGIIIVSLEGTILFANQTIAGIFELPDTNLVIGKKVFEFMAPESTQKAIDDFINVANGVDSYISQYNCFTLTGKSIWIESIGKMINYEGKPTDIISLRDITERKLAEAEIHKISKHYQALIEKALDGIVLIDADGDFKYVSPSARKMFGYSPTEDISGSLSKFTHPDDLYIVLSNLGRLAEDPSYTPTLQYRFIDKNGNWKWVESTFSNLLSDPSVEAVAINFRDISERKKAEETLQDIIEKNPMSIQIVDSEGYTLKTNPANTALFGAVPPPDCSIFDDIQSKSEELERFILLAKSGEVVNLPDIYYNPHDVVPTVPDNPKWIRAIIFPLKDSCGKPDKFVLMHEDITERKNAEATIIDKVEQILRSNDLMVGREMKMIDLKKEINQLLVKMGEPEKYVVVHKND